MHWRKSLLFSAADDEIETPFVERGNDSALGDGVRGGRANGVPSGFGITGGMPSSRQESWNSAVIKRKVLT
jgi:hypothetical protein